jgi:DNA polymerase I-like protein with 3'-5' exonuclease and polymerase domains
MISYVHDEIVLESPEDRATAVAAELAELMISEMRRVTPDVPVKVGTGSGKQWIK